MRPALALLAAAALVLPGCAAIQSVFKPSPPIPEPVPTPARVEPSPPPLPVLPPPPTPRPGVRPSPPPVPVAPPPPTPRPRVEPAPLPPLQPQLTEAEERRLLERAARELSDAERAVQAVRAESLTPPEREIFEGTQGFLRQAREALASRHYERAIMLAQKAKRLAQDLPQTAR